jgi:hypothetical protein
MTATGRPDIDAIEALLPVVSEYPWTAEKAPDGKPWTAIVGRTRVDMCLGFEGGDPLDPDSGPIFGRPEITVCDVQWDEPVEEINANIELVLNAPVWLAACIAHIRRLEAENARLRAALGEEGGAATERDGHREQVNAG